jgi:hypothetical protein
MNYNKVKVIIQKKEENPIAFYDRLEEAFRKYTTLDPESIEGAALLTTILSINRPQTLDESFRS